MTGMTGLFPSAIPNVFSGGKKCSVCVKGEVSGSSKITKKKNKKKHLIQANDK